MYASARKFVVDLTMAGCVGVVLVANAHGAIGQYQDEKKGETAAPNAAAPAPINPTAFPTDFTRMSLGPDEPLWPDPTGAWATRSLGPLGDGGTKTKTTADLYDRIAHNLFSVNFAWTMVTGFLVMFMHAAFAVLLHLRRIGGQGEEGLQ